MPGLPWRVDDLCWETWSETALAAHRAGRARAAARLWAHAVALAFEPGDPRRAASLNNGAVAAKDRAGLEAALAAWDAAEAWVSAMTVTSRARSSTFHLRLEARHRDAYDANARALHRRELGAGRAVTLANLGLLDRARGGGLAPIEDAARLRSEALGAGEAGAVWLAALAASLGAGRPPPAPPALPWPERRPVALGDGRRLFGAIYLAAFARPA